jgi:hypothetical protein
MPADFGSGPSGTEAGFDQDDGNDASLLVEDPDSDGMED